MAQPAAVLSILVTAQTLQAQRDLTKLNAQLGTTATTANKTSSAMKSMVKGAGLAAVGVTAAKATSAFVDFDRSMRNVNSIAKLSEKRFDDLSSRVLKLAGPTAQAPKTLADGLYQLVSSGFDANESIKILSKTAVAATAGLTDTATATQVVAAAINAYGLQAKDAGHVSDVLFKTVDRGVVTFSELAQSLGPVLPAANSLNVSLEQVGAAIATLTKQGFPAAEAATAIDAAMRALLKPSQAMKQAFKDLGVAGGEELVRKYGSLQAALVMLRGTTDGSGAAMNKLFNEIRGARGALTLTGENARGAAKDLQKLGDASGATSAAFKEQAKSAAVQWERLKAEFEVVAVTVGNVLFPVLRRALIILLAWDKVLMKLPLLWFAVGKVAVNAGAGIVSALGDVFRWMGKVAGAIKDGLSGAFRALAKIAGNVIAFMLHRMADVVGAIGKIESAVDAVIPGSQRQFRNLSGQIHTAGDKASRLGKEIGDLPSKKRVQITLDLRPPSGIVSQLGDGWGVSDAIDATVQNAWTSGKLSLGGFGGGAGSANLMGANANLGPFARLGARMGLHVSSGLRPGAITDSGNLSYHAMGRAIDMADGAPAMLAYARMMASNFGSRLKELIHTPLGFSIKNGVQVPPYSTAAHYNHVHVAMAKGGITNRKVRALVGEEGPEIVDLPLGARVHPFSRSKRMVAAMGGLLPGFAGGGTVNLKDGISATEIPEFAKAVWGRVKALSRTAASMPKVFLGGSTTAGRMSEYRPGAHAIPITKAMQAALADPMHRDHWYAKRVMTHEMAHAAQSAGTIFGPRWEREGGAEVFSRWAANKIYGGGAFGSYFDYPWGYPNYSARVLKHKSKKWWQYDQFAHGGANARAAGMVASAPGSTVARAAMAAGFKGANLLRAVAEAKGESGWNERAVGDGGASKGLMQIHTGWNPWAASLNLFDPFVNMRAAMRVFQSQGWGAWHADHTPWISDARAAIASVTGRGVGSGGRGPRQGTLSGGRNNLPGRDPRHDRTFGLGVGGVLGALADWGQGKFGAGSALAALTADKADDIANAQAALDFYKTYLPAAIKSGDTQAIQTFAGGVTEWQGTLDGLLGATEEQNTLIEQQIAATEAHTQAVTDLKDQQKRNEDLIRSQGPSLIAALTQTVNGGIGGPAGSGRMFPSSTGLGGLSRA